MDIDCIITILEFGKNLHDIVRLGFTNKHYNQIIDRMLNNDKLICSSKYDPHGWLHTNNMILSHKNSIWHAALAREMGIKSCYTLPLIDAKNLYINLSKSYFLFKFYDYRIYNRWNSTLNIKFTKIPVEKSFKEAVKSGNIGLVIKLLNIMEDISYYKYVFESDTTDNMLKAVIKILPNSPDLLSQIEEYVVTHNNIRVMKLLMEKYNRSIGYRVLQLCKSEEMFLLIRKNVSEKAMRKLLEDNSCSSNPFDNYQRRKNRAILINCIIKHIPIDVLKSVKPSYYINCGLNSDVIDYIANIYNVPVDILNEFFFQ